jgi:glycosyltransferase involved in cell wall biosynthesis
MRAGMVLRTLARRQAVSLLVIPLYASPSTRLPARLAEVCRQSAVVPPTLSPPAPARPASVGGRLRRLLGAGRPPPAPTDQPLPYLLGEPFEIVHLFRLATLAFAQPWLNPAGWTPRRHLDLDDLESVTHRRIAALYRANGDEVAAQQEERAARRSEKLEDSVLSSFERVYVCSESDRQALLGRARARLCVLPNALPVPPLLEPRSNDSPFTFLFIGTLGYYPNEDGVLFFCEQVLPLIRRRAGREFRVDVVGTGPGPALLRLAELPEVQIVGPVPEVAPWYRQADAVVVPLRAGGGTRIKVLEAFSYRRPVVSTPVGSEGLDVRGGEHLLLGDTPAKLAAQCLRLMDQPALAASLAETAFALFRDRYSQEAVAAGLEALEDD